MRLYRWAGIVAGIALCLWGLSSSWTTATATAGVDFYHYWIAGQEAPHVAKLYAPETQERLGAQYADRAITPKFKAVAQHRRRLDLTATPFLYTCFAFFPADYDRATTLYAALLLICLIAAVLLLGWRLEFSVAGTLFLLAAILLMFQPLKSELRVLNVEELQLLLIAGCLAAENRRPMLEGALLGLAIAFKPNIAFVVPLLIAARILRDRPRLLRELGGVAIGGAAAVIVSSAFFRSPRAWIDWLSAARDVSQRLEPWSTGNVAVALPLIEAFGTPAMIVLMLLLTALACWAVLRGEGALAIALAPMIYILSTGFVWMHYLMLAVPLIAILFASRSMLMQGIAALGFSLIAADPWDVLLQVRTQQGEVLIIICGAVIVFAAGLLLGFRPGESRAHTRADARHPHAVHARQHRR